MSGMVSSLSASKDTGVGVIDLAHICESESVVNTVHATVVGSAYADLELDLDSGHRVRSSNVHSVSDTRQVLH